MKRRHLIGGIAALSIAGGLSVPLAPAAIAQAAPVTLTVGYQKVAHLAPMILLADALKAQGVEIKLVEFARYADAARLSSRARSTSLRSGRPTSRSHLPTAPAAWSASWVSAPRRST